MADPRRFYNVPGGQPSGSSPMYQQQQQTINPNMASGPIPPTSSYGAPPPPSYGGGPQPPGSTNGFSSPNSQGTHIIIIIIIIYFMNYKLLLL